ncbi:hypothetical protein HY212_06160 [Candidatus Pacearchaeota archaeon]|nr:hypothetical protein [Candidatus Pacearchaeota archaeon]
MKHIDTIQHGIRNRKGISSVVGTVFFIIVFTSVASYIIYSMNQIDQFGQAVIGKSQDNINKNNEAFEITSVTRDNNKFNITLQNTGQLPVNITRLWIQNKTDPTFPTSKFTVNQIIAPGQTLVKVGQNLKLTALPSQAYDISLVTERGNVEEVLVNSASQKPLYLQLYVLPDKIPTGFSSTLLFAVTNNMSNNGILTNLVPRLNVTSPIGTSAVLVSGPEPSTYPTLQRGDTAYFKWIYNMTGNPGQQINFLASLQNGYLGNIVSRNATITPIQGMPSVKTTMGGGLNGTTTSTTQSYLRFFGDGRPSITYSLKSMTMPMAGTFKNLYVNKGSGSMAVILTLYNNGVATSLSCQAGTGTPSTCSDTNSAHAVNVAIGNTVAMGIKFISSGTASGDVTFTVEFDPS